jgi:hypothetical protein
VAVEARCEEFGGLATPCGTVDNCIAIGGEAGLTYVAALERQTTICRSLDRACRSNSVNEDSKRDTCGQQGDGSCDAFTCYRAARDERTGLPEDVDRASRSNATS